MRLHNDTYLSNTSRNYDAAAGNDLSLKKYNDASRNEGHYENRNLSDIVSRIQDEGPVTLHIRDTIKKQNVHNRIKAVKNSHAEKIVTPEVPVNNSYRELMEKNMKSVSKTNNTAMPVEEAMDQQFSNHNNNHDITDDIDEYQRKENQWLKIGLVSMFFMIVVMAYFIYQLQVQSEEMAGSINEYSEYIPIIDDTQKQSRNISDKVSNLNSGLTGLKNEINVIQSEFSEFDKLSTLKEIEKREAHLIDLVVAEDEMTILQATLEAAQRELMAINAESKPMGQVVVSDAKKAAVGVWTVNLASLSSLALAEKSILKLRDSGVEPSIQEAIVNGQTVYRLSVTGFSTVEAARDFMGEARAKHGFNDAWVRPG